MRIHKVASSSVKGREYLIRELEKGEMRCNCPDFVLRKHECKHIKHVKEKH